MLHVWAVLLVIKWYKRPGIKQLTMMVHPTDIIEGNKLFEKWISDELNVWSESLDKPSSHEDRVMLMREFEHLLPKALEFYPEEGRPTFVDVAAMIPDIVNDCRVYRITGESDDDDNIKWDSHRMNVLVGAQKLNRGFTVEKLATTYMPRYATGITNADTIEQRCRFFGYKRDYIESCRVYLPKGSIEDYRSYVRHEEELRTLLASCSSLKEYEHRVMLSPKLRPTRQNVLPKQVVKTKLSGFKVFDKMLGVKMLDQNRLSISKFVSDQLPLAKDFSYQNYDSTNYDKGEVKKHLAKTIKANDIVKMLADYAVSNFSDVLIKSMTIRYIQYLETIGKGDIKVIFMSQDMVRNRSVEHQNDGSWVIKNLFQGRSNINEPDNYCGDRNIADTDMITIQIHRINLTGLSVSDSPHSETYALAIHFPPKLEALYVESVANVKE